MSDLLPGWPLLSAFLAASFILAVTPGPAVLYIVTRTLVYGRRHGLISVSGIALGNFVNACAVSVGLAALFAVSSAAFTAVKYVAALYLVWLGIQMWRSSTVEGDGRIPPTVSSRRAFRDGFVVALLNPKTTVFFAAFLPQFVDSGAPVIASSITLGGIFVAIGGVTDGAYAIAAGSVAPGLRGRRLRRTGRRVGGGVLMGLGVLAALSGVRGAE